MKNQNNDNIFTKMNTINSILNRKIDSKKSNANKLDYKGNNILPIDILIGQYEFILENNNENNEKTPNQKTFTPYFYKTKIERRKKIKENIKKENDKQNIIDKKKYFITKKYLNKKSQKEEKKYKKITPYNFKHLYKYENKKHIHKSMSNPYYNNFVENNKMESNFMKLEREANIYTSNAPYIQNKKMLLFNKFNYDNNEYKPDRAKLFDMTRIPNKPNKNSFIYKTTKFRVGHLVSNNNSESVSPKGNMYEKFLQFRNFSGTLIPSSYVENTFQKRKRYLPSDTLYKELMSKKNETFEYYLNNVMKKEKKKDNAQDNENKDELLLYSFYKNKNNKTKINIESTIKKLYYKQMIKNNADLKGYSSLLNKKKNNLGLPLTFPTILSSNILYDNKSQKERYEKLAESFYHLKELIINYKKEGNLNELDYIYEYAVSKNIDKKYLTVENLNNFYNFLFQKKLPIDLSKSIKENIILALTFDKNKKKEEKKKNIFIKKLNLKQLISEKRRYKSKDKDRDAIYSSLMIDMDWQNKITKQEKFNISDRITIRNELKKELEQVKNEVINKQKIMQNIQNENILKRKNIINNIRDINSQERLKKEEEIFDSNERLYYTWYKNKNSFNINNFVKKSKLTELYFYNRNNKKIKQNEIEEKFFRHKNSTYN